MSQEDDWPGEFYLFAISGAMAYSGGWMLWWGIYQSGLIIYMMSAVLLSIFFALLPDEPEDQEDQA